MSDGSPDPDVTELLADLTLELRRLQRELGADRDRSLRRDMARFTSEVAIPALILVLKTNVKALELLRRAIRIAEGRDPRGRKRNPELRERAEQLGQVTLARLDDVLEELQGAVEGRPRDERSLELIEEARDIRQQIETELDTDDEDPDDVDIDIESELRALKDDLDDDRDGSGEHDGDDDRTRGDDRDESERHDDDRGGGTNHGGDDDQDESKGHDDDHDGTGGQ